MVSCSDFLENYSDYRDGLMDPARRDEVDAHLAGCSSCARYHRVVSDGVQTLLAQPELEPSYDFLPRLQHRLYSLDAERVAGFRREDSGASLAFVLLLIAAIGAAAWMPAMRRSVPTVELPPVVAVAPRQMEVVHSLFREGPLLGRGQSVSNASNTIFFRYTPLGSYAGYPISGVRRR